jgi:hypothetical protein
MSGPTQIQIKRNIRILRGMIENFKVGGRANHDQELRYQVISKISTGHALIWDVLGLPE